MKKFFEENRRNPWFWAFVAVAAVLFFAMPTMSRSAGNSGDEDGFQIPQGNNVLEYYRTDHQDTTCMTFENLKYYGCSFDVVTAWFNQTFHVDDISKTRHEANAFLGWVTILFVGLIVWRMGGWRAAVLAMVLMFLSPRFLGHSFNNPKDIPLAAGVTMAIYYMMMFFRQAPKPKISTMVMLAFSLAFAISIRIGALIIIGYFGLWGLLWIVFKTIADKNDLNAKLKKNQQKGFFGAMDWGGISKTVAWALAICVVGFFAGLLLWPYAMQSPIKNSVDSYHAMAKFAIAIRQIYNGEMMWSDSLPWYYTPKFIFSTIPLAVILGWVAYPFLVKRKEQHSLAEMERIMLYFCFIFPVAWIVYTKANVYGGWRHSLFAYPPMVAAAGLGFDALVRRCEGWKAPLGKVAGIVAMVLPFAMLIPQASHIVRNHPYEYVYFNKLVGGTEKNFAKYEMDYYYHSMREATEWVMKNAEKSPLQLGDKIVVGSWHINSTKYFLRHDTNDFQCRFVRWYQKGDNDWDYAVFPLTGIDPAYLTNEKVFPPKDMVYSVDVDGVPIAVVLKRQDKNDFIGAQLKAAGNLDSAIYHFNKALAYNPYNEAVLLNLGEIYLQKNMPDSTLKYCNRFFEFEPNNDNANYFAAYAHMMKGDADGAINICNNIKKHNFKYGAAYQLCITIYLQRNDLNSAEAEIFQSIDADQINDQIVQYYVAIQKSRGLDDRMAYMNLYNTMAKSAERRGKKEQAEQYRSFLRQM